MNMNMNSDNSENVTSRLVDLLVQTGEAHGEYEELELQGMRDEQWPTWYAVYLRRNGLSQLLGGTSSQESVIANLESVLVEADTSYKDSKKAETEKWPEYFARHLLSRASTESSA